MLKKFRGTNEAEPRKQCESLARARVAFSMFLATLVGGFEKRAKCAYHSCPELSVKLEKGPRYMTITQSFCIGQRSK